MSRPCMIMWRKKNTTMRKIIIVMLVCIMPHVAFAQGQIQADSSVVFALHEKEHHYYFDGDIGGTPVKFALDTGSPAMLISEDFYDKHKDVLQLEVKDVVGKKLKIQRPSYNIRYRGRGHLSIGNAIYHGPVTVLSNLKTFYLPIQYLMLKWNKTSIVKLDLPSQKMSLLTRRILGNDTIDCNSFPLGKTEKGHFPTIRTHLSIFTEYKTIQMDGDFIVDTGNANLLYLSERNEEVAKLIEDNSIERHSARNKYGLELSKGLYADQCAIAGYNFKNKTIGLTDKLKSIEKEAGMIGVGFFISPVIFDFNKKKIYIKPNNQ